MNYLPVNVYTSGTDCSLNGVTFTNPNDLVVPCEDGHITEEDVEARGYIRLVPGKILNCPNFTPEGTENKWTMMGGNFVYSTDSRFSRKYGNAPVAVHDRIES